MPHLSSEPAPSLPANNLDTLRLLLALMVVFEHTNNLFTLARGNAARFDAVLLNLSDVAVSAFFVISGMLTYVSFQRDPDKLRFYLRRMFRVFPAYWSVVLLQILAFVVIFAAAVLWAKLPFYTLANLLTANFLAPSFIDGVPALNGSLWTIKIEASYYLILPFLFPLLVKSPALALLALASLLWAVALPSDVLAKQLPGKLYLFALGVALARMQHLVTPRVALGALLLIPPALVAKFAAEDVFVLKEITLAFVSLCFVIAFLRRWSDREAMDISYTLYLVHYPLLVVLTRVVLPDQPFVWVFVAAVVLSVLAAFVLSVSIERPALKLGRALVAKTRRAPVVPRPEDSAR